MQTQMMQQKASNQIDEFDWQGGSEMLGRGLKVSNNGEQQFQIESSSKLVL